MLVMNHVPGLWLGQVFRARTVMSGCEMSCYVVVAKVVKHGAGFNSCIRTHPLRVASCSP
jgi:hypothetical protein